MDQPEAPDGSRKASFTDVLVGHWAIPTRNKLWGRGGSPVAALEPLALMTQERLLNALTCKRRLSLCRESRLNSCRRPNDPSGPHAEWYVNSQPQAGNCAGEAKAAGTQKERHLLKADQFGRKDVYDLSGNNYVCGYNLPGAGTLIGIIPAFSSVGTLRPFVGSDLH